MGFFSTVKNLVDGDNPIMDGIKERLEFYMRERGLNKKRLSLGAGLNETAVRDILALRSQDPRLSTILKLARYLQVLPHDICPDLAALYPPEAIDLINLLTRNQQEQIAIKKKISEMKPRSAKAAK